MVRLPRALEEKRIKLLALARRQAFESYVRYGRVPGLHEQAAAFAVDAEKALGPGVKVSVAALPSPKPTRYYTWRSAGDERVRSSHVALNGRVFAWNAPPAHGHPGTEPNCRCWAEPYFGDPAISDTSLKMQRAVRRDTSGTELWSSIETLTRPDGSLAQSSILGRDGTRFWSLFAGNAVSHLVTLATGGQVRFDTSNGVQTSYLSSDRTRPILQTAWTAKGPVVQRARRDVAFLMDDPSDLDALFDGSHPGLEPEVILPLNPAILSPGIDGGLGLLIGAFFAYYGMQQAAPTALGLGVDDTSFAAFKAWARGDSENALPIFSGTLTDEQVRQACKRLPEVQEWTDRAASELASERLLMDPTRWGTAVHKRIKDIIEGRQSNDPSAYADLYAEISIDDEGNQVYYSRRGSTRLDIVEDRRADMGAVCVYDIKTGKEGLTAKRVGQIARIVVKRYGETIFYIIEVRPGL